jgi:hypothetical protein
VRARLSLSAVDALERNQAAAVIVDDAEDPHGKDSQDPDVETEHAFRGQEVSTPHDERLMRPCPRVLGRASSNVSA